MSEVFFIMITVCFGREKVVSASLMVFFLDFEY